MIPLFSKDEVCPVSRKACLNTFKEHAVHCRELPGFKYRHDLVRDVLFDIFRRAGISVKKRGTSELLDRPTRRKIDTSSSGCDGVWTSRWKACMYTIVY
ncbi:hypothetical protein QL285_023907 [Trifolium repens]|nr:hypothetical protein QL285_023907 [Trifolium repens]